MKDDKATSQPERSKDGKAGSDYYRAIFQNASSALIVANLDGEILDATQKAQQLLGYSLGQLTRLSVSDIFPADWKSLLQPDRFFTQFSSAPITTSLLTQDESKIDVTVFCTQVRATQQRDILVHIQQNKAEGRNQEELISQTRFHQLIEHMRDAAFLVETETARILAANKAAEEHTGYSRKELIGMNIVGDLSAEAPSVDLNEVSRQLDKGTTVTFEEKKRMKDGSTRWEEVVVIPIESRRGKIHMSINRDISDKKRREKIERAIIDVNDAVNTVSDLGELFPILRNIVARFMDVTNFRVALLDKKTNVISLPYIVDEKDSSSSYIAGDTLTTYVISSGEPLLATREEIDELIEQGKVSPVGAQSKVWLGVPLWSRGEVIGAIIVQNYTDRGAHTNEDLEALRHISENIGLVIANQQAKDKLQESEELFRTMVENSHDALLIIDENYNCVYCNQRACEMTDRNSEEIIGQDFRGFLSEESRDVTAERDLKRQRGGDVPATYNIEVVRKDGNKRLVEIRSTAIHGEGEKPRTLVQGLDITEREQAENKRRAVSNKIEALHDVAHQLENCVDEEMVYKLIVNAAEEILSFSMCTLDIVEGDKLIVQATSSALPPEASREMKLEQGGSLAAKTFLTQKTYRIGQISEDSDADPTKESFQSGISVPIGQFGVFQVVSEEPNAFDEQDQRLLELLLNYTTATINKIRLQEELRQQAIHDPLTGAFNRRYFEHIVESEIERATRYDHQIGFLAIDVNGLKQINDTFGHKTGDRVLQGVVKVFQEQLRDTDVVVRFGGDEFMVVLLEAGAEVAELTKRIKNVVTSEVRIPQQSVGGQQLCQDVTISVGYAYWTPGESRSLDQVLEEADKNMYEDKRKGNREDR